MISFNAAPTKNYNCCFNNIKNRDPENYKNPPENTCNKPSLAFLSTKQFLVNFTGSSSYKTIDAENWPRKELFNHFSKCQNPFYSITARSDVSKLLKVAKKKGIPSSHAILYIIGKTINDIPEFKYRLKDEQIIKYDKVGLAPTIAKEDGLLNFCNLDYFDNAQEFLNNANIKIESAKKKKRYLS